MPLPKTALLLNPDGSIYHLNLLPGELAETIILVGDPQRTNLISKHFDHIEIKKTKREFVIHTGRIGHRRLSVIGTGIGSGNIDIVINEADALFNVDFKERKIKTKLTPLQFIRFGTAGALQPDIPVDSCVISEHAIAFDGLMHYYAYDNPHAELSNAIKKHFQSLPVINNCYSANGSTSLMNLFPHDWHRGITLSLIGFYGPQYRSLRASLANNDLIEIARNFNFNDQAITNFEMETAAIYGLSHLLQHQCCSISTVIVNRITDEVSPNPQQAIENMIEAGLRKLLY